MAILERHRVTWTGSPVVGPGVSTFYFQSPSSSAAGAALHDLFEGLQGNHPAGITWVIESSGVTIDSISGDVNGAWSYTPAESPVTSTGGSDYANGVGMRLTWLTDHFVGGRRSVGATFMVPLVLDKYTGAGNLADGTISGTQSVCDAFVAADVGFCIYSRPTDERVGSFGNVVAARVPDLVSWLRSRRT